MGANRIPRRRREGGASLNLKKGVGFMSYIVIAKTRSGKRLQIGRAYGSHQAALDLAALVRGEYPSREVFVESAPGRRERHDSPSGLADLLSS
jgi:hypothetical protein